MGEYRFVYRAGQGEITEKKSRFIAAVQPVTTPEEALAFVAEKKKEYWDARHNCYAYVTGARQEQMRCSDDGEPSGTAGRPMLDVLLGEEITNVIVIVTRYFGGTLLGTGGLVRAYSKAVQEGLANSRIIDKKYGVRMEIQSDYNGIGKIQYLLAEDKVPVLDTEYTDKVTMQVLLPKGQVEQMKAKITEGTNGRARMREVEDLYFAVLDGEILYKDALSQHKTLKI